MAIRTYILPPNARIEDIRKCFPREAAAVFDDTLVTVRGIAAFSSDERRAFIEALKCSFVSENGEVYFNDTSVDWNDNLTLAYTAVPPGSAIYAFADSRMKYHFPSFISERGAEAAYRALRKRINGYIETGNLSYAALIGALNAAEIARDYMPMMRNGKSD